MKLKEHCLFELKRFLDSLSREEVGEWGGDEFKGIAIRHNLKQECREQNSEYEKKYDEVVEAMQETRQEIQELKMELEEQDDVEQAETTQEYQDFVAKSDENLQDKMEEIGFDRVEVVGGMQRQTPIPISEEEVEFTFEEEKQKEWLKEKVKEYGPDKFDREEDLIELGNKLGV